MKIFELFNNTEQNLESNKNDDDKFDLDDDLIYYMHNNDDVYRKNLFPILHACNKHINSGNTFSFRVFKPAVLKSYEMYKKEFPLRELQDELEEEMVTKVCKKIHDSELENMRNGAYK